MSKQKSENNDVSSLIIAYEFSLGLIELMLGVGITLFGERVAIAYRTLRDTDFLGEQHDLLADFFQRVGPYFLNNRLYIALLLVALGLVKIVSSIGLWRGKEWGRHLLVGLLVVLIPFDTAALVIHPSILDLGYLVVDILITLYMINFKPREYYLEVKRLFR